MKNKIILIAFTFLFFAYESKAQEKDSIQPISSCVSELYVANSFSGNGDGVNDIFLPRMIGEPFTYEFTIYNRWGEVIFTTTKIDEGWTGTYKDHAQPMDVYVWTLKFTCKDEEEKYSFSGNVTLVR